MTLLASYLPEDGTNGTLIGRVQLPASVTGTVAGPSPVMLSGDSVYTLEHIAPTSAQLLAGDLSDTNSWIDEANNIGSIEAILANTLAETRDTTAPYFLTPIDIQAVKACGVTFACSMLERMIEERAGGDPEKAAEVRTIIHEKVDVDLAELVPGSEESEKLKAVLQAEGLWSQYLEVGIGPYAEVFSKCQPLSSVGLGEEIGLNPISSWNNPEPELVVVTNPAGDIVGATLGNDVNLRDVEGRSALLLGKAKDNNASSAIGPFIRLLDDTFSLEDVRQQDVKLNVKGTDGFEMNDSSNMTLISRDVTDLVSQTLNASHQYPDGIALYTGTVSAPVTDRDETGMGFTHKLGDVVSVSSAKLGCLQNTVTTSDKAAPWEFGISQLYANLKARNL